jgi:predicted O-methyltransferase YrrM
MYNKLHFAFNYLKHYLSASNGKGHGTHSPFVFNFITNVLNTKNDHPDYEKVEQLRHRLKQDSSGITVEDLGAGPAGTKKRSIGSIARRSLKSKKFGQLFYRMVREYKPGIILELGTSLGVTTCYFSMANPSARVITMEGAAEIAALARKNFEELGLKNIELVEGNFDNTLENVLSTRSRVDLAFIDGNHRREPTERYFRQLLSKTHNDSIIILDDIHWSPGMETAWKNIIANESVTGSVDLYFIGILFFRQEFREKQNFRIRF